MTHDDKNPVQRSDRYLDEALQVLYPKVPACADTLLRTRTRVRVVVGNDRDTPATAAAVRRHRWWPRLSILTTAVAAVVALLVLVASGEAVKHPAGR